MPIVFILGRQRQEHGCKFDGSLGCISRLCLTRSRETKEGKKENQRQYAEKSIIQNASGRGKAPQMKVVTKKQPFNRETGSGAAEENKPSKQPEPRESRKPRADIQGTHLGSPES